MNFQVVTSSLNSVASLETACQQSRTAIRLLDMLDIVTIKFTYLDEFGMYASYF